MRLFILLGLVLRQEPLEPAERNYQEYGKLDGASKRSQIKIPFAKILIGLIKDSQMSEKTKCALVYSTNSIGKRAVIGLANPVTIVKEKERENGEGRKD